MHLGAQLFEPLLMGDTEVLLLIDDQESEIFEVDRLAEQGMGADDDIDAAVGNFFLHLRQFRCGNQSRGLRDVDGKSVKPLGECLRMLAGQQRGGHHDRHLLAVHCRNERCPQRHLGLAEAHVAADQSVHGTAGREFAEHHVDRGLLVFGLLIGKAGAEFVVGALLDRQARCLVQLPLGRDLDQLIGDLADAAFHARFARLPGAAAQPVELGAFFVGPVARQELDILDGQEQTVVARIHDRGAVRREGQTVLIGMDAVRTMRGDVGPLPGGTAEASAERVDSPDEDLVGAVRRRRDIPVALCLADLQFVREVIQRIVIHRRQRHLRPRRSGASPQVGGCTGGAEYVCDIGRRGHAVDRETQPCRRWR